jgi:helix-turn-helix protein
VDTASDPTFLLQPEDVHTVSPNHTPSAVRGRFDRSCGLKCQVRDSETVIVLEPPADRRRDFLQTLFRCLLEGSDVIYTHPAREGGRVLSDSSVSQGRLSVRDDQLVIEGDETVCTIELDSITNFDTATQTLDATRYRSVDIQHIPETRTVTTLVAATSRRATDHLNKYVHLQYSSLTTRLSEIEVSDETKRMLIGLHSIGATDVESDALVDLLGMCSDRFEALITRLEDLGVVETDETGLSLTPLGRVTVAQKLDDVNI